MAMSINKQYCLRCEANGCVCNVLVKVICPTCGTNADEDNCCPSCAGIGPVKE